MTSGIYCYTNKINNKKYVGQSQNLAKRIGRHGCNFRCSVWENTSPRENKPLWQAVKKYGIDNFYLEILEYCSVDDLDEKEIYYIQYLGSHFSVNGYNLSFGGKTVRGAVRTDESRRKMSKAQMGKKRSKEHRDNISKGNISKKRSYSTSKYLGVHCIDRVKNVYWVVDVKKRGKRLFSGSFSKEIHAAVYYDCCVLFHKTGHVLNFSEEERQNILNSAEWKSIKRSIS